MGLRQQAEGTPEASELWLRVRDAEGLADRLEWHDDWAWQTGLAALNLSPQDLGVLDDLVEKHVAAWPYSDDERGQRPNQPRAALWTLRRFLAQYQEREFALEDPTTYRQAGDSAPAS